MPARSVRMPITPVRRKQLVERFLQVALTSGAGLHQSKSRGGVGDKHIEQSVPPLSAESEHLHRQVGYQTRTGFDLQDVRVHFSQTPADVVSGSVRTERAGHDRLAQMS